MTSTVPPDGASLHRYPGTSCLATISLSLRDKSHSPIEAPHNYLSAYGVTPRGLHCLASYLRSSSSSSFVLVRISGGTSESPAACFLYA